MMKSRNVLLATWVIGSVLAAATLCPAATVYYTWQGTVDTDWGNSANWDVAGVPVDQNTSAAGLNGDMVIQFTGSVLPQSNVPGIGGLNGGATSSTPILDLTSGGMLTVDYVGIQDGIVINAGGSQTVLIVGDGVGVEPRT